MTLFEIMTVSHNFKTATALAYKRGKLCTNGKYVYNRKKGSFLDLSRPLGRSSSPICTTTTEEASDDTTAIA
jgi:hypothetical protein